MKSSLGRAPKLGRRVAALALGAALVVGLAISAGQSSVPVASSVSANSPSSKTDAATSTTPAAAPVPKPVAMATYPAKKYAAAAKKLPAGLKAAVSRDVGETGAQYLADAAAAVQAPKVVAALKSNGVDVLGSSIHGTKLTVNVASAGDVAAVEAAGAIAVVGAPKKLDFSKVKFHTVSSTDVYGGQAYYFSSTKGATDGNGYRCSIGFPGYSATGASEFTTAGHCETIIPSGNSVFLLTQSQPTARGDDTELSSVLGKAVTGQYGSGTTDTKVETGSDYGVISSTGTGIVMHSSVATWGGEVPRPDNSSSAPDDAPSTGSALSTTPVPVYGETASTVGATMCKSGSTSGWTCGIIEAVDYGIQVSGQWVNTIVSSTCLLSGDSGGGAMIGNYAVGIDSGSSFPDPNPNLTYDPTDCDNAGTDPTDPSTDTGNVSVFFPMVSDGGGQSVSSKLGSSWQLGLTVSSAAVTSPASGSTVNATTVMRGTLANANSTSTAKLYLDGSTTASATASASSGSWSFPLHGISAGSHTYSIVVSEGFSTSTATTGSFTMSLVCPSSSAQVTPTAGIDFNCDGNPDFVATDNAGTPWLYDGNGSSGFGTRVQLGTGFQGMTDITPISDFNGDGKPDVIARDASGNLWLYPGNGTSGLGSRVQIATGWGSMTAIQNAGDFNGDGHPDVIARDSSGVLWLYPGNGTGGFGSRVELGTGWASMTSIIGVGDFNGDGKPDVLARNATGTLYLYPNNGSNGFGTPVSLGSGWSGDTLVAAGDFNGDGHPDLFARDSSGTLWLYESNSSNGWLPRIQLGTSFGGYTLAGDGSSLVGTAAASSNLSVGIDFNKDGNRDLIARTTAGALELFTGNGSAGFTSSTTLATGWQGMSEVTPVGDFNGDGNSDVVARDASGNLWLYPGNGSNGFGARIRIASGWQGMTALQSVGDVDGDGHTDLLARDAHGNVLLYPGTGTGGIGTPILVATGWQGMTAIVGIGDFNGDGHPDVLARDSGGTLWLYPGNSSDGFGNRISLGSGWNGWTLVGAGDFNGDGYPDLFARDPGGLMYLYEGNGTGGWLGHVGIGSTFSSMTLAGASTQ